MRVETDKSTGGTCRSERDDRRRGGFERLQQAVDKAAPVVDDALVGAAYAYELRRGGEILATGRLTAEHALAPGDEVTVAGIVAQVKDLSWVNGEARLMLQPARGLTAA
jgi:hypothetical protein